MEECDSATIFQEFFPIVVFFLTLIIVGNIKAVVLSYSNKKVAKTLEISKYHLWNCTDSWTHSCISHAQVASLYFDFCGMLCVKGNRFKPNTTTGV